jgi:Ca-activated chloride channel family protein
MSLHEDDPKLTAYALGELDAAEREALEATLGEEDRRAVEAIRSTAVLLEQELGRASGIELDGDQRTRIEDALAHTETAGKENGGPVRRRLGVWWTAGIAAAAALALVPVLWRMHSLEFSRSGRASEATAASASTSTISLDNDGIPQGHAPSFVDLHLKAPAHAFAPSLATVPPAAPSPLEVEPPRGWNREGYDHFGDNPFILVATDPRSTFSIDVDTASYALVRRFLRSKALPPTGAVRIEELVNYFSYGYDEPPASAPISITAGVARAPWASDHLLARIALKGRHIDRAARPPANLVFLVDVSGSMDEADKLPLVKEGLRLLTEALDERDHVSIVVYAGASGLALAPTPGNRKHEIVDALERLQASGSTNGAQGIQLAYEVASRNFDKGGVNRVILATDGDFNVGVTSQSSLVELIEQKAKTGVFLSVLGFGHGNYQDSTMEKLADKGNGHYAYIDSPSEARKVLVDQATGTLVTVAKDVKVQIELNPAQVEAFRLIGYENRVLAHRDFNDDKKDAGEVGADHTVTALYELAPAGVPLAGESVDALRYGRPAAPPVQRESRGELFDVKVRYKLPNEDTSHLIELPVREGAAPMSDDFRFAAAVAEFGMLLRDSPHKGSASYENVIELARSALGTGREREARSEFVELAGVARTLQQAGPSPQTPPVPAPTFDRP